MTRPRLHPEAHAEYLEALLLLEEEREGYGDVFESEVEAVIERIAAFPRSGAHVRAARREGRGDVRARAVRAQRHVDGAGGERLTDEALELAMPTSSGEAWRAAATGSLA